MWERKETGEIPEIMLKHKEKLINGEKRAVGKLWTADVETYKKNTNPSLSAVIL